MSDPLDTHNTSGNKGITKLRIFYSGSSKSKARGELKITTSDNNESVRNEVVRKRRKTLKKKGKVYIDTKEDLKPTDLRTRSAPANLYEAVKHISSIACLRDFVAGLGFEKILNLSINIIPSNLAYKILECYNVEEKSLVLKGHEIKITRDLVHEILDDHIFFRCRKNEEVDQPILASDEVLLLDNKGISGNECGLKDVCESSKSREVGIDFPVNDDYNNLVFAPVTEDEQIQNNFKISKEKEDSDVETTSFTSYDRLEIQQVHSNKIDTSKEEQPVSPNFKQVVSDLKRCIHHFSLHDNILSKDEEVAQYKKELLLLFIGKDTPQIQTSSHEVSDLAISDQFVVDTTDTVANEEGDKEEENLSEESEKLDLVVKKNDNSKTDETEVFNTENDEEPAKENIVNIDEELPSNSTNALFIDLQVNDADSVSILQDDVTLSNGGSRKLQLEVADISNVGIPASENASNIEGDSVEGNVTMKDDLSAAFENDGFFESPKNEVKADEGLDKEVNDNLQENVFAGNDQNVTSETFLLQESEKSKVDIEQPLVERMDTINVGSHVTTDADFNVQSHSGEKGNVDVMDVPNEFSTECTEIDATDVQNVDAMCVQNVDAMNLQNDFSTSVMVGEELLQNVTMKEDLSADSGNGGCLEIQKNEDSDTISCIPDEASEKEINEHVNVNTDIMNVQPTNDSSIINTEIDDKTRAAAEEHDLPTQDGLVVQTDVSSNADFHVDIIGVQNEISAGDFQSKFVEFPESPEGQSNDEIFTEDSKKENDKFEVDSAFPVTAELQREIQTEDTSNIQMETLDVQNAGCLKINDFEECDTISKIQEPTNDSSHSLPLEGIDMQMDNGNPISKTLPEPNENVFAMNGNVKTIDSPHSLAMERSEMHIDEVPSASQKEVHLDRGILMKVNIEEEIPSASQKGGSGEMMCHTSMSACEEVHLDRGILLNDESSNEDVNIEFLEKTSEHEDLSHLNALEKNSELIFLKSLLVDFLARNNFTNTNLFLCEKDAKVLNLRRKTRNDKINCGLYAMIHMEHYEFEDEEWEIGILDEEDAQHQIQMDVLRNRYITKILLHEINQHKRKMIHFAENWISENPDEFEEEGT
ncbi:hypothetical protein CTI12_AA482000 [Artemisia annua]|uniref:Ulp1 protease family, C-terminal catalytic domain-containing protein n=1 Tax=Artemisia annua TaxID=35608 RepID=A0A2U1LK76_ARTAN|nr:hypothetical protein CTI12_AA482000 [Artemisia annua]